MVFSTFVSAIYPNRRSSVKNDRGIVMENRLKFDDDDAIFILIVFPPLRRLSLFQGIGEGIFQRN